MSNKVYHYENVLIKMVREKIKKEFEEFLNELINERPEVIIERSYEKVCKEELYDAISNRNFSIAESKVIIKSENFLDACYTEMLELDNDSTNVLDSSISIVLENSIKFCEDNDL